MLGAVQAELEAVRLEEQAQVSADNMLREVKRRHMRGFMSLVRVKLGPDVMEWGILTPEHMDCGVLTQKTQKLVNRIYDGIYR